MLPATLSVPPGTDSVPSPLKRISSTIAFGYTVPFVKPVAENTYRPSNFRSRHAGPSSAHATLDANNAIAAPANAHFVRLSPLNAITIGIVCVAARAARMAVGETATMTSTRLATSSAAMAGSRSILFPASALQ